MAYECSAFRQCPRQGIHPSKYCSYLPPPPTSGRGPGTWFRGHAPHLKDRGNAYGNTVTALPAGTAADQGWRAGERRWDAGGMECREADVTRYHKTSKSDQVVRFKYVLLSVLRLYLNKVREERERELASRLRPQKRTAGLQLWKAGFNEKIQLGSKLKETRSKLSEKRRLSQVSPCWAAHQGTLKSDHWSLPRLSEATGLNRADTWDWNQNPDLFSLSQLPLLFH